MRNSKRQVDWHPDPKVHAMQLEIQQWMEKNDLADDTGWEISEDDSEDEPECLVLTFEGELNNVLRMYPPDVPDYPRYVKLRAEFDEIVQRHGYWFDFKDNVTVHFMVDRNG